MTRILLSDLGTQRTESLVAYRERGGYSALQRAVTGMQAADVQAAVAESGLRGRGGAAFPTAKKWELAARQAAPRRFVVANGGEHEPGSDKDKVLVARHPHSVLEGMALCAYATGADEGVLYLIEDMAEPLAAARAAIDEARAAGLLGRGLFGSAFSFDVRIHRGPTTYVAGEETAALDAIAGGPGRPRKKPPYPGQQGIDGMPTTVNNVETLAHVAWIVREGGAAFSAMGTTESKGTLLFTLGREVRRPGVYELPFGSTYRHLIDDVGGGLASGRAVRAVLPAMSCGFLAAEHLDVPIGYETLKEHGTGPGCGGVRVVAEGDDPVDFTLRIAEFFMREQCGQCPPCRMETNQMVHVLQGVLAGKGAGYAEKLDKLAAFARGKGFCSLIEMAAAPVLSALRIFADDFRARAGG
ncbi:MAG: NADH-ubiquinone oxidoreductase-F iron-sulfur binding region domain-containing protein [Planctomycetota bacterium]